MPDHLRKQIRDAVATTLDGLTTTGNRVHQNLVFDFESAELPALNVIAGEDKVDGITMGSSPLEIHRLDIVVEGYADADGLTSLDDTLDLIDAEVQAALFASPPAMAKTIELKGAKVATTSAGDRVAGAVIITFEFVYHVREGAPTVAA